MPKRKKTQSPKLMFFLAVSVSLFILALVLFSMNAYKASTVTSAHEIGNWDTQLEEAKALYGPQVE